MDVRNRNIQHKSLNHYECRRPALLILPFICLGAGRLNSDELQSNVLIVLVWPLFVWVPSVQRLSLFLWRLFFHSCFCCSVGDLTVRSRKQPARISSTRRPDSSQHNAQVQFWFQELLWELLHVKLPTIQTKEKGNYKKKNIRKNWMQRIVWQLLMRRAWSEGRRGEGFSQFPGFSLSSWRSERLKSLWHVEDKGRRQQEEEEEEGTWSCPSPLSARSPSRPANLRWSSLFWRYVKRHKAFGLLSSDNRRQQPPH